MYVPCIAFSFYLQNITLLFHISDSKGFLITGDNFLEMLGDQANYVDEGGQKYFDVSVKGKSEKEYYSVDRNYYTH